MGYIEFADVYEMACDGCCGRHDRADEVGAAVAALAAFEIAIEGAGAALVWRQHIRVHADTPASAGIAPFKARLRENFVQTFFFRLRLDAA